jgi:hypothetical protein
LKITTFNLAPSVLRENLVRKGGTVVEKLLGCSVA